MNTKGFIRKNILAVLAVMFIAGFSSFKLWEKLDPALSGWYEVEIIDSSHPNPETPENLQLGIKTGDTPPNSVDCSLTNTSAPCQVFLDMENFSSSTPIEDLTLEDAEDAGAEPGNFARSRN